MPELRSALEEAGFGDVKTYVQSGNVVLSSRGAATAVARKVGRVISTRFDLDIEVVVRTRDELAGIVKRNPHAGVATDPKRYQVTFLSEKPGKELIGRVERLAAEGEKIAHAGRELYVWHPDGIGRSKLAELLAGRRLGVVATSRNWRTVEALLELVDE